MYLKNLVLTNFKNYTQSELEFSPRINCFVGDNGVGKTNLLDAIHYLSLTKSYFMNVDSYNIRHGENFFIIKGVFNTDDREDDIYCGFQKDKRKVFKRNGKDYSRMADHIGRFPVVMISPADSRIISDGSEERRKFMNNVISQYNRQYLESVIKYNKALKNRNKLLKGSGPSGSFDKDVLSVWDKQMVLPAETIHKDRSGFINEIIPVFQEYYDHISQKKEIVEMKQISQLSDSNMEELLEKRFERDRILQYTTAGIHRDDLKLVMDGHPIRGLGSQGQQKSYLVALKLAKFEYIRKKGGQKPLLLMDDVFDKFDKGRVEQIINLVSDNHFGQIFITDTNQERLQSILSGININYKLFRIKDTVEEVVSNGNTNK